MSIRFLAFLTIIVTYVLIVFGGYVASSESGMGCGPDWPLCNGMLIPILKGATLIEFAHRVIGAILFIMSLTLFVKLMKNDLEKSFHLSAYWMITLLTLQVILGALVVVLDLPAIIVTIHFIIAMVFLGCLIFIWRSQGSNKKSISERKQILPHISNILLLLFITLGLGAYIKHQSYGLACDWLTCGQSWLPSTKAQVFQSVHRIFAILTTVYILCLTYWTIKNEWNIEIQKRMMLATITILVQLLIGIFTIITTISIPWAVLHLAAATALFVILVEAWIIIYHSYTKIKLPKSQTKTILIR